MKNVDFAGWATKCGILCSDGRTIMEGAFDDDDGRIVPLVWNHDHSNPENVLGHALLQKRPGGMYAYCSFNDTESGELGRKLIQHGDIAALSIYANKLKQDARRNVQHGVIREVSLVLAGANPGALIEDSFAHSMDGSTDIVAYTAGDGDFEYDLDISDFMAHADEEEKPMSRQQILESMNEDQKNLVYELLAAQEEELTHSEDFDEDEEYEDDDEYYEEDEDDEEYLDDDEYEYGDEDDDEYDEEDDMKHNVFDDEYMDDTLSHADVQGIFERAKTLGSMKDAVNEAIDNGVLAHSIDTTGMDVATGDSTYGINDMDMLFPEFHELNRTPEWIKRDTGWVSVVLNGVKHSPFSRIRTTFANITEDEARAKGYIKGNQKKEEVFPLLRRTVDPQTVYKKQKFDRDDLIDITSFDVVAWIKGEMRIMLDEELARAILVGDGRSASDEDKIKEDHIRPVVNDVPLFSIKVELEGDVATVGKNIADEVTLAFDEYKGSGNPICFMRQDVHSRALIQKDGLGYRLYKTDSELATAMLVSRIVNVPKDIFGDDVYAIILNLNDYSVGADKGGSIELFDDFDIDYNQYKYLIETRCSGMLTKPYSAIVVKKGTSSNSSSSTTDEG